MPQTTDPDEFEQIVDDSLPCPEVGRWAETKHSMVALYATLFASGIKAKWDNRTYIELYAGSGYNRIEGSDRLIAGSPLRVLQLKDRFNNYIFCEKTPALLEAMEIRVARHAPWAKVSHIAGDCNSMVQEICVAIPAASSGYRVLSLCFVDPFDIGIKFETLRVLSTKYIDFLVLLCSIHGREPKLLQLHQGGVS